MSKCVCLDTRLYKSIDQMSFFYCGNRVNALILQIFALQCDLHSILLLSMSATRIILVCKQEVLKIVDKSLEKLKIICKKKFNGV